MTTAIKINPSNVNGEDANSKIHAGGLSVDYVYTRSTVEVLRRLIHFALVENSTHWSSQHEFCGRSIEASIDACDSSVPVRIRSLNIALALIRYVIH
jgi:hypothetical protein